MNNQETAGALHVIPVGGLGEVGKNMMYIEYEDGETRDSIIVDAGLMFPENDMQGIDYIIPDFRSIMDRFSTVRAVIVTHGHEDHTGAIAHLMEHVDAPIYATPLTRGLLEVKLKNAKLLDQVNMVTIQASDNIKVGPFLIEFFHVCHSIPDGVGLGVTTPVGLIVHTGDFKFDHTPVDGWPPDFSKLADFASRDVLALFSDSTNATVAGWTPSESVIDDAFFKVFREAPGRIIIATFASLISRIQQVANVASVYNRKIAVVGYSMVENVKMARSLGYLDVSDDLIIDLKQADKLPNDQVVVMTTGTQGEPSAGLGRLANGTHRQLEIEPNDTVVLSSHPIPGNAELVHRTINKLLQRGAHVIYDPLVPVHVSGHASQEELKLMINLVRPRFFVPVHGELRHLYQHAQIAYELGIPKDNIAIIENGTHLTFTSDSMAIDERVPGGYVFVDGTGVGDIGPEVLRDREILGSHGFVIINLTLKEDTHDIVGEPEMISRGFVFLRESEDLIENTKSIVNEVVHSNGDRNRKDLRRDIQKSLERFFYKETKRRPMVFAFITEV